MRKIYRGVKPLLQFRCLVTDDALVGGEAGVFGGVAENFQHELQRFGVFLLSVEHEGEEDVELAVVGELRFARTQHGGGTDELAERAERRAETEQRAGEFVGRQAERDGFFVVG